VEGGLLIRHDGGRATAYSLGPATAEARAPTREQAPATTAPGVLQWSPAARAVLTELSKPVAARAPVTYQRRFVDSYVPNQSALLPPAMADRLFEQGRSQGRLPAGTYARRVLEQLLIDLSWHSSRLEGNRLSLLDTRELFARGRADANDPDATMLLNHKDAIEFLVDAVPEQGLTVPVVRNLHSLLMQGLMEDARAVGAIRRKIVNIDDSVYVPSQVPSLLEEMLALVVEKSRLVRNPLEAAFFLWVNIAYLQPFEDGNKRTSRLSANIPLLLGNCAPLSFLDVDVNDYAHAMLGVYERRDTTMAGELFEWTYRRSIAKYRTVQQAIGVPGPLRVAYREQLRDVVQRVVGGDSLAAAVAALGLPEGDWERFEALAREELRHLEPYNCARYRLSMGVVEQWIRAGRPGI
jgi:fido (protein-threonine AMPylation protein)